MKIDLRLDLVAPRTRPWPGWGLLMAGLAALAWQGELYRQGHQQLASAQAAQAAAMQQADSGRRASAVARPSEASRQLMAYLATPWEPLLALFESHARADVTLQRFEPEAAGGTLEVSGRASSLAALTRYLTALEADRRLSSVLLQHHHAAEGGDGTAIEFNLVARWGAGLGRDGKSPVAQAGSRR